MTIDSNSFKFPIKLTESSKSIALVPNDDDLIKSAVLSYIYKSPDLTYFYLMKLDERNNSSFCNLFQKLNKVIIPKKVRNLNNNNNNLYRLKYNKYNDLTAEHIFPQSFIKEYSKAKFDMHNIYLTTSNIYTHRSNYKYCDESKLFHAKDNNLLDYNNEYKFYENSKSDGNVIQEGRGDNAELVLVTHEAAEDNLTSSIDSIANLDSVSSVTSTIRVYL